MTNNLNDKNLNDKNILNDKNSGYEKIDEQINNVERVMNTNLSEVNIDDT